MAVNYLKKKKMHVIMCDIFGIAPKMIDTDYKFYRGTEWLQYCREGKIYEICAQNGGVYLISTAKEYDYEQERYNETWRKVHNGYGRCTYTITKAS